MKDICVYILASRKNGTLYTGVTGDLVKRTYEHKQEMIDGFTKKYNIKMLVWFEKTEDPAAAIQREKQIKKWKRKWKIELIEQRNPEWNDLYKDFM